MKRLVDASGWIVVATGPVTLQRLLLQQRLQMHLQQLGIVLLKDDLKDYIVLKIRSEISGGVLLFHIAIVNI